jgi:hypothetical protein
MRPLCLNDGSCDCDMIDPLVVIPFLSFVLEIGPGAFIDHVNHSPEGRVYEVFLLWW